MSDPDRMEIFLASMRRDLPPHLASLEAYAKENYVPVIRPAAQDFLRTYLAAVRPARPGVRRAEVPVVRADPRVRAVCAA